MAKDIFKREKPHVYLPFPPKRAGVPETHEGGTVPVFKGQMIPYVLPGVTAEVSEILEDDLGVFASGLSDDPDYVSVASVTLSYVNSNPSLPNWTSHPRGLVVGSLYLFTIVGKDFPGVLLADDTSGVWTVGFYHPGSSLDGASITKVTAMAPSLPCGFLSFGGSVGLYRTGSPAAVDYVSALVASMSSESDYTFTDGFLVFDVSVVDPCLGRLEESFTLGPFVSQDAVDSFFAELAASNGWLTITGHPEGRVHNSASMLSRIRRLQRGISRSAERLSSITGGFLDASSTPEDLATFQAAVEARNRDLLASNDRLSFSPIYLADIVNRLYPSRSLLFPSGVGSNFDDFYELNRSLGPDRFFEDLRPANGTVVPGFIEISIDQSAGAHEIAYATFRNSQDQVMSWRYLRIDVSEEGAIVSTAVSNVLEQTWYDGLESNLLLLESALPQAGRNIYYYLFASGGGEGIVIPGAIFIVTPDGFSVRESYAKDNWVGSTF